MTRKPCSPGTQGSRRISVWRPSLIALQAHLLTRSLTFNRFDQKVEVPRLEGTSRKLFLFKYLALRMLAQIPLSSVKRSHPHFASKARFISCIFLRPRPPHFFGWQILSQGVSAKRVFPEDETPHQQRLRAESTFEHIPTGRRLAIMQLNTAIFPNYNAIE